MKYCLLICLSAIYLNAFELYLNAGEEAGNQINALHIKNSSPFSCYELNKEQGDVFYKCELKGKSKFISDQDLSLFKLEFKNHPDKLEILITPKTKSRLINSSNKLYASQTVYKSYAKSSTDYTIEFFPKLNDISTQKGLDFGVIYKDLQRPFIGALDLDQNPVVISDNSDINIYLNIKKAFDAKDYKRLLELSNKAILDYSSSIFLNEFYLYKMRAYFYMLDKNTNLSTDLIDAAKSYLKTFTSSPNYPEVVRMLVHAYLKLSQRADADYFIDILNNEQPNDYYTKLANLDYADFLLANKKKEAATVLYNNILFSSNDPELASKAAIALAKINIFNARLSEAKEFVLKVLQANEKFLLEQKNKTISLADEFYKHKMFDIATNLYELVLNHSSNKEAFYERALRNLIKAYMNLKDFTKAKIYLDKYKKTFINGEYQANIDEIADSLYFEQDEKDSFKLHEYYRLLMAKYDNYIAKRALEEEIKLLYKEHNYSEIYALKDRVLKSENSQLVDLYQSAIFNLLKAALHQDECASAFEYLKELPLNQLNTLRPKLKLVSCLHRLKEYKSERMLATRFRPLDSVAYDIVLANLDELENNYAAIISRLQGTLNSHKLIKQSELAKIYRLLSISYLKNNQYNQAIFALKRLEKIAEQNMQLVELYSEFLGYFKLHNLNISAINYGQKAILIQNRLGVNLYSPELEFITLEALNAQKQYAKMLSIIVDLAKLKLNDEQLSRMYYLKAQAHLGLKQTLNAQEDLKRCVAGQWANLCADLLNLIASKTPNENEQSDK